MKTSDKLLLFFFLSVLGLYGAIHLALYARSKQGKMVTSPAQEEGWGIQYKGDAPSFLSLQGNGNVRLIPSDTFFIEFDNNESSNINCRRSSAANLVMLGESIPM